MPIAFYRDEWLRMKMSLYDGNVLRMTAIERAKARLGRWKTGRISGKRKWKPGGTVWARRELRVALTVNRDVYETLPIQPASQVGKLPWWAPVKTTRGASCWPRPPTNR